MKQSELGVACRRLVKQSELGVACRRVVKTGCHSEHEAHEVGRQSLRWENSLKRDMS